MPMIFHAGKWWNDPKDRTQAERAELFGDVAYSRTDTRADYETMLVERFQAGLPLTIDAKRKARRLIREAKNKL